MAPNLCNAVLKVINPARWNNESTGRNIESKVFSSRARLQIPDCILYKESNDRNAKTFILAVPRREDDMKCPLGSRKGSASSASSISSISSFISLSSYNEKEDANDLFMTTSEARKKYRQKRTQEMNGLVDSLRIIIPDATTTWTKFRFLKEPFEVEYQHNTRRYMFSVEAASRKEELMAKAEFGNPREHSIGVAHYFLMDDRKSWVQSRFDGRRVIGEHFWEWQADDEGGTDVGGGGGGGGGGEVECLDGFWVPVVGERAELLRADGGLRPCVILPRARQRTAEQERMVLLYAYCGIEVE